MITSFWSALRRHRCTILETQSAEVSTSKASNHLSGRVVLVTGCYLGVEDGHPEVI